MPPSDTILPNMKPITDNHGRPFLNFRISVTQRCNLRCSYCHKEGQLCSSNEMAPSEIARIARIAGELGAHNLKLTGGEPLVREDVVEIVRLLHKEGVIQEISMVTNGTLLTESLASSLKQNGLMRMNINIPSVEEDTYRRLTGGELRDALEGARAASSAGLCPVKVNMLMLRDLNHDQVNSMLDFCSKIGAILQIIELEPLNIDSEYYSRYHFPLDGIEKELTSKATKIEVRRSMHGRRVYHLGDARIEVVRPVENTVFCLRCSRMRLTSDGRLKSCLMRSDDLVDLLGPIRRDATDRELSELIAASARRRQPFYVLKQAASPADS